MIECSGVLDGRTIAVVVPAYNEAELIRDTLGGLPAFVDQIIVVDDASTDATGELVKAFFPSVVLLSHDANRGVGAAIATGCRRALALGADFTAIMAGDGQMHPDDLPALLQPLIAEEVDFTKGNRLAWPSVRSEMPWHRRVGNQLFSSLTRQALGIDVHDSQCGYAAMSRRASLAIEWDRLWRGYGYPNDLLSCLSLLGLRVRDVPVRPIYGAERSGIRLRHVACIIPFVIIRGWLRRTALWPTSLVL
ncbi:MAG TPA: glycosyltransferase family 2 protein [Polyangiales bacterium]|nr:glycosyltransferase family 2 protein [Polyangiales bacterium]